MTKDLKSKYQTILRDNRIRSLLKAISYRVSSTFITFLISYIITGNLQIALTIGGIDVFAKILLYYVHERIWHYSSIGR